MALPPTVPTSFVPKQPVQSAKRPSRSGLNLFTLAANLLMVFAVLGAGLTFGYQKFLEVSRDRKAAELAAAEASISRETVQEFLRLHNRLAGAERMLVEHVALSQFFEVLEALTLESVSFDAFSVTIEDNLTARIEMKGEARSFNALAAQSAAFAAEKRIKRAIFASIVTTETGRVSFALTAELDPKLVAWDGPDMSEPSPVQTSAATTTTP